MARRLRVYRALHDKASGQDTLANFFELHKIAIKELAPQDNILVQVKAYVEINGKFKNFMSFDEEHEKIRLS
jgi:hypothetical protein